MSFPYAIGEVWVAQYRLFVTITGGTAGLKFKLNTLPAGVTGRFLVFGPTSGITAYTAGHAATLTTDSVAVLTGLVAGFVDLWVYVANGSAAGTIDLMVTTGLSAAGTIFTGSSVSQMRSQ